MGRRRRAPKDLDRLYMTSSDYRQSRVMSISAPDASIFHNLTGQNITERTQTGNDYRAKIKHRQDIFESAKELQKHNMDQ